MYIQGETGCENSRSIYSSGGFMEWGSICLQIRIYDEKKAHEQIDFTDYEDLFAKYDTLTKISFDYAVAEKEEHIQVMRFHGQWKDLGTWNTLTEAMEDQAVGKAILNEACKMFMC